MATKQKEVKVKTFTLVRELSDKDKCPPQAKTIVNAVKALGGAATREQIVASLKAPGVVETTQSVERIFGFYRPRLTDMGVLKEEVTTTTVEVPVAEKPAKAPKAPKEPKAEGGTKDQKGQKQTA